MQRVTREGGILFVRDLMRPADPETLAQLVETYTGEETKYSQKLFADSLHAALSLDEIRAMVQAARFRPQFGQRQPRIGIGLGQRLRIGTEVSRVSADGS